MKLVNKQREKWKSSIPLTIEKCIDDLLIPVRLELDHFIMSLKSSTITVADMWNYLENYKDLDQSNLDVELRKLCRITDHNDTWVTDCCHQIQQFFLVSRYRSVANIMHKLVKFSIPKGDFPILKQALSPVSKIFQKCLIAL